MNEIDKSSARLTKKEKNKTEKRHRLLKLRMKRQISPVTLQKLKGLKGIIIIQFYANKFDCLCKIDKFITQITKTNSRINKNLNRSITSKEID